MKPSDPKELAESILERSVCQVQVGAVITDKHGIISWGWNSSGADGLGICAERHAILRANRNRLKGAEIYVAAVRVRNGKVLNAFPCKECQGYLERYKIHRIHWRTDEGKWMTRIQT